MGGVAGIKTARSWPKEGLSRVPYWVYRDVVVRCDGVLKFAEKQVIYDTLLLSDSIVFLI